MVCWSCEEQQNVNFVSKILKSSVCVYSVKGKKRFFMYNKDVDKGK